jgi:hypothetical protein
MNITSRSESLASFTHHRLLFHVITIIEVLVPQKV